ncbi:MAG: hypothetical protein NTY43_05330 [Bacteroidetes bacterium]|jgi:hypothetical protein|nr:hypothetical protein [Bacteroidota bacterium]
MKNFKLLLTLLVISMLFFACIKMEDTTIQVKKEPAPIRST